MNRNELFENILYEFTDIIDDSLIPETTVSSFGLKLAMQMQPKVKLLLNSRSDQPKADLFAGGVVGLFSEFGYGISVEYVRNDRIRFKMVNCLLSGKVSPSLCAVIHGIIGGLGFLNFNYSKTVTVSGSNRRPKPCYIDVYIEPTEEAKKEVGIEYSKGSVGLLQGEADDRLVANQRQARRKLILGLFTSLALSSRDSLSAEVLAKNFIKSLSCFTEIRIAALYLKDESTGQFELMAQYGLPASIIPLAGTAVAEGDPGDTNIKDLIAKVEKFNGHQSSIAKSLSIRSFVSVKIKSKYEVVGVLNIGWKSSFPISPEMREALHASCALLGTAIDSSKLYTELENAYYSNISMISQLVNVIDRFSNNHSKRVAELAKAIAYEMGLQEQESELVYRAGLLHDIGKIILPPDILNKPDQLTEEEFKMVKEHPVEGAKLLSPLTAFRELIPAILYHHERLDGSGYPKGLAGEQIPLHARIIAVAEVYDAMITKRSYREAKDREETLQEIVGGSGLKYDSEVVRALVSVLNCGWSGNGDSVVCSVDYSQLPKIAG